MPLGDLLDRDAMQVVLDVDCSPRRIDLGDEPFEEGSLLAEERDLLGIEPGVAEVRLVVGWYQDLSARAGAPVILEGLTRHDPPLIGVRAAVWIDVIALTPDAHERVLHDIRGVARRHAESPHEPQEAA